MHREKGTCGEEEQKSAAAALPGGAKTCGLFIARALRILGSLKRPLPRQPLFRYARFPGLLTLWRYEWTNHILESRVFVQ